MAYSAGPPPPPPYADGYRALLAGDPAPWFEQAASGDQLLSLELTAGRFIVLCFFVTAGDAVGQRALSFVANQSALFESDKLAFYGVTIDWRDQADGRVSEAPGRQFYWDFDLKISRLYGAVPVHAAPGPINARRMWCILDPTLRVRAVLRFERDGSDQTKLLELLHRLLDVELFARVEVSAPVLFLPNVFEDGICRQLIQLHEQGDSQETGFLRQVAGKTVQVHDPSHKRRVDLIVSAPILIAELQSRIVRRVVPELAKAYQFAATRIERYLVGCYRSEHAGHFAPHRDNTTSTTQHRRFAMSLNLNDDYEGGEIGFPEYGSRRYRPPRGGAVLFSCSLLHSVSPVTRGNRYAFLPFLHDEAAELVLRENTP